MQFLSEWDWMAWISVASRVSNINVLVHRFRIWKIWRLTELGGGELAKRADNGCVKKGRHKHSQIKWKHHLPGKDFHFPIAQVENHLHRRVIKNLEGKVFPHCLCWPSWWAIDVFRLGCVNGIADEIKSKEWVHWWKSRRLFAAMLLNSVSASDWDSNVLVRKIDQS